ncbi:MAG: hypothetical protein L0099_04910 [Acidobacteria bacterium]|nr:hypothetical protein [Acidobacteriota bacterium]
MKPEDYSERKLELSGWPVHVVTYRLGKLYYCKVDNVSPGAQVARASAATREDAEQQALAKAGERLAATRKQKV